MRLSVFLTTLFPLWAVLAAAVALMVPEPIAALRPAIVPLLGVVMFGMGLTLRPGDFLAVARRPVVIALGAALQVGVMPAAAWSVV